MSRTLTVTIPEQTFVIDLDDYDDEKMAGMTNEQIREYAEYPDDYDNDDLFEYAVNEIKANMNYDLGMYRVDGEVEADIDEDLEEYEDVNKELLNEYYRNLL